jgi:glyoxylase-like metal-dependent hydrolase (beta-lactamase superfamily II)
MLNVELYNVGWLRAAAGLFRRGDGDREIRIPVPAYVIETAQERILVDTGFHPAATRDPASHYGPAAGLFKFEQDATLGDQVDLASLTKVVLTHLHFDHAGGLALLPPTLPIVVQRREWEAGQDEAAIARNYYVPADYAAANGQVVLVDGDHDLLGDGPVRLLSTPGHTPGHQSVQVGERLVLGGDVTHFARGLDDHRFPSFGDDFEAQAASADRLRALRDAGATVMPGHDPEVIQPGPLSLL